MTLKMSRMSKSLAPAMKRFGLALASTFLLVGCGGGGGGSSEQSTPTARIVAFGDSVTDSGTYGGKYIVNNTTPFGGGSNSIWVDSIAQALGVDEVCPFFRHNETGDEYLAASYAPTLACTNFAAGGARINALGATAAAAAGPQAAASPKSIPAQLITAANVLTYSAQDTILISAAGNDAGDLFSGLATLLAASDPTLVNAVLTSVASIDTPLIASTVQAAITEEFADLDGRTQLKATLDGTLNGYVRLSAGYLAGLAGGLKEQVDSNLLEKGVEKVVILNMPNVLKTPAFQAFVAGAGLTDENAQLAEAVIGSLVGVFNVQLTSVFADDSRVFVYDFNALGTEVLAGPTALGFTNTAFPSCGLVEANQCSEQIALATVFAGVGPTADWETFAWADAAHPGELVHDLMAQRLVAGMRERGWR